MGKFLIKKKNNNCGKFKKQKKNRKLNITFRNKTVQWKEKKKTRRKSSVSVCVLYLVQNFPPLNVYLRVLCVRFISACKTICLSFAPFSSSHNSFKFSSQIQWKKEKKKKNFWSQSSGSQAFSSIPIRNVVTWKKKKFKNYLKKK